MDKTFLLEALKQAALGRGSCAPNPSVGAVVVRNAEIIARAFHKGVGTPHAEVLAFQQIPEKLDGTTLYVTLEPCNHWGCTPPCVNAIIEQGVKKVVYGYRDPNPVVQSNDTPSILNAHGIECHYHALEEIDTFYESYKHWRHTGKPFVTAKIAQTLDGKIAYPDYRVKKISNETCNAFTHQQRKCTDVILTSMRTVNNDDPLFNARINDISYAKDLAIIDTNLQLNLNRKIFDSAGNIHIYHAHGVAPQYQHDKVTYHAVSAAGGSNLEEVISHLGKLGYHDVWVEVGSRLFSALHDAHLVDKTYIYVAPEVLGNHAIDAYSSAFLNQHNQADISSMPMGSNSMFCFKWKRA